MFRAPIYLGAVPGPNTILAAVACAVVALVVATAGAGRWSLDRAFEIEFDAWWGAVVAAALGIGGAVMQLAISYRPKQTPHD